MQLRATFFCLLQAILARQRAETLSSVLYPDDRTYEGKELRLKQQHFFVSATIQDTVRRYREAHPDTWEEFPNKVSRRVDFRLCFRCMRVVFRALQVALLIRRALPTWQGFLNKVGRVPRFFVLSACVR